MDVVFWFFVCVAAGCLVTPLAAAWLVDGRPKLAVWLLAGFLALCGSTPSHAGAVPWGFTSIGGSSGSTVTCTPGAVLFYMSNSYVWGMADGVCPAAGTVSCGFNTVLPTGQSPGYYDYGSCAQSTSFTVNAATGGGGGTSTSSTVVILPPLSATDGALVSAAIAGVWFIAFGWRAMRSTLDSGGTS